MTNHSSPWINRELVNLCTLLQSINNLAQLPHILIFLWPKLNNRGSTWRAAMVLIRSILYSAHDPVWWFENCQDFSVGRKALGRGVEFGSARHITRADEPPLPSIELTLTTVYRNSPNRTLLPMGQPPPYLHKSG